MKAIILIAAKSEKLSPFTETCPKSMIPMAGTSILNTLLLQLKEAGITEIWMVVNHLKEQIKETFQYGRALGLKIDYINQGAENGIGKALSLCKDKIGDKENFMLVYGDVLMAGNSFIALQERYLQTESKALATISHPASEGSYGNVYLSHDMKISKLIENPEDDRLKNYIFGGSFILPSDCFNYLEKQPNDMVGYFQELIRTGQLAASLWENQWIDISHPWHILEANKMAMTSWVNTEIPESVKLEPNVTIKGKVHFGENVHIGSGTTIIGPCYIGNNVYIGDSALIRKNTSIGDNVKIGYGTEVKNSVLFGNSTIGRLSFIGDSVLGKNVQIGSGTITVNYDTLERGIALHKPDRSSTPTKLKKLGALLGENTIIGTGHTIAPGTVLLPDTTIEDRITISNQK